MTFSFAPVVGEARSNGPVRALAVSPDGELVAVATQPSGGAALQVLRLDDGAVVASFGEGTEVGAGVDAGGRITHCACVAFADGGRTLWFSLGVGGEGSLWVAPPEGARGAPQQVSAGKTSQFASLCGHPRLPLVAVAGQHLEIRDTGSREVVAFVPGLGAGPPEAVLASFAADGPAFWAWGTDAGGIALHDPTTPGVARTVPSPSPFGRHLAASADGRWLLASGTRGTHLHDRVGGARHDKLPWYETAFSRLAPGLLGAFSPGSDALVYLGASVTAVDLAGEVLRRVDGPWPTDDSRARRRACSRPLAAEARLRPESRRAKPGTANGRGPSPGGTTRTVAAAAASDAPVFAFATDEGRVLWFRGA